MIFKNIDVLDENYNIIKGTDVLVKDDKIIRIAPNIEADGEEVYNGKNKLIMSGLYNAHMHIPMSLMRGYGENLPLDRWLNEKIFPFEDKLNTEYCYNATFLQIAEMLRSGTVCASDMYFFSDAIAKATKESGFQMNIARCMTCFDDSGIDDLQSFAELKQLYNDYHNSSDGRIIVDTSIHAEYTSTKKVVSELAKYAKQIGANMQIHLSETQKEHKECIERHNMTPAEFFCECGAFDVPTTAAHCVWVTDNDIKLMAEKNVTVAHCPVSNLKLASGVAPIGKFLNSGVNVALGTDSVASNNNANLFEEVKLAAILHKGVNYNPTLVSCEQAIKMATVNGAKAQGRDNCGLIKEGYKANLIVIDLDKPNMQPDHNQLNNIVYSLGTDNICMTMVDGKILYKDGEYKTIDVEKAIFEVNKGKNEILASM